MADDPPTPLSTSIAKLKLTDNQSVSTLKATKNLSPTSSAFNNAMIQTPNKTGNTDPFISQDWTMNTQQIDDLQHTQDPSNPFKCLSDRVTPVKKITRTQSASTSRISTIDLDSYLDYKRKRAEGSLSSNNSSAEQIKPENPGNRNKLSSNNSIVEPTKPENPGNQNKRVSFVFSFQNNNNDDAETIIVPDILNTKIEDEDPARDYKVIPEASAVWMLALDELRTAARHHSRMARITKAVQDGKPDLWSLGIMPAPEWMATLIPELSSIISKQAEQLMEATKNILERRLQMAQKQANRYMTMVKETYVELSNDDFPLAEKRLLGIVSHYRFKEKEIQKKFQENQEEKRPKLKSDLDKSLQK